ncbi:GNAT family N-acetyltransferase [Cupriavidus basilensis]|uniref:Histone acetyltransferase HPA2-related acetyltransferase n=1 Tax=Cupriavidus basilensis TaxID=68895 RepID=A0A0C4YR73_9BURK|nr:GNAT family N-acetyltransferase [Cupriavidus basilensis]AJG24975.1 Histone acetyltransferase HPA2-related acetyltransferase [Cupriavidus basilensis]
MDTLIIRHAGIEDAAGMSALALSVAHYFTIEASGAGAEDFLASLSPDAMSGYVTSPRFHYLVACRGEQLAGILAMRDVSHLFHLFVAPQMHRSGIAGALWQAASQAAIASGEVREFTVNSSPFATVVYERFGFRAIGPRAQTKGIAYVPMRLARENARSIHSV